MHCPSASSLQLMSVVISTDIININVIASTLSVMFRFQLLLEIWPPVETLHLQWDLWLCCLASCCWKTHGVFASTLITVNEIHYKQAIMLAFVCVVFSIMSLPAAYCPIEFSSRHKCGLQRLRNIIDRLHLRFFVVDVSLRTVSFFLSIYFSSWHY